MYFSSSPATAVVLAFTTALLTGMSVAAAAPRADASGTGLKSFQKQQAQDYAKSKQLKSSSSCIPTCKQRPGNYGCQVVLGAAAGAGAGLAACCKKACGG